VDIRRDDLRHPAVIDLLRLHLDGMRAHSPEGSVFALDLEGLKAPDVSVWTAWRGETCLGIGALRRLSANLGEVKSMRTHPGALRQGVGAALLERIIATARAEGLARLSLETGSGPAFAPALALYRAHGFTPGAAFGGYTQSPFNQFLHLDLGSG
jgi:putative acetyltransferase